MEPRHDGAAEALRARRAVAVKAGIGGSGLEIRKSLIPKLRQWMFAMALGLMFAGAAFAETPYSDTPEETASRISLWPDRTAPGSAHVAAQQRIVECSDDVGAPDRIITHVTQPHLVVYRPRRPNSAALRVIP